MAAYPSTFDAMLVRAQLRGVDPQRDADESLVYAVRANGEDYMLVAEDAEALAELEGSTDGDFGQCVNCGCFTPTGEVVGYDIYERSVRCQGCGAEYPIRLMKAKEVCF